MSQVRLSLGPAGAPSAGRLLVALLDDNGQAIHQEEIAAETVAAEEVVTLAFAPQIDSAGRAYTLRLIPGEASSSGLLIGRDQQDRYPGLLRRGEMVLPGDLAMEWHYQPTVGVLAGQAARGLARYGLPLMIYVGLWTLPGLALLLLLRLKTDEAWSLTRWLASAVVLSGAVLVILPQFTTLAGLRLGPWAVWGLLLLSLAVLGGAWRRNGWRVPLPHPEGAIVLYLAILGLVVASRFAAIAPASAPMWGDSVHHALITQMVLDQGGIPDSYEPYVPLESFTYHVGFHLLCAWLAWSVLPGMPLLSAPASVLLGGQLLNVWAVVAVGLLAEGLTTQRSAGRRPRQGKLAPAGATVAAALAIGVAGLVSPVPAFYVNWGRYTQLAGQIFLPAALLWGLSDWQAGRPRRSLLPVTLALAAMALSHYRVVLMYAVALPVLVALLFWQVGSGPRGALLRVAGRATISGVLAGLLALPWYARIASGLLVQRVQSLTTLSGQPNSTLQSYNDLGSLTAHVPQSMWVGAGLAALWLVLRRRGSIPFLLGGWVGGLFLLSNPYTFLRLPGTGLINNFMIQIGLYIPLSVLIAIGAVDAVSWLRTRTPVPVLPLRAAVAIAVLAVAVPAAWQQSQIVDVRTFAMQVPLDEAAVHWITHHTPPSARFHINGFPAFGGGVVAGADGGWWLWLSARRETTVPPMVYDTERGQVPTFRDEVNGRFARLQAVQGDPAALAAALRVEGIEYLYVGAQQGRVGLPPEVVPLDPIALANSTAFETVFTNDFAWVFRVRQ